MLNHNIIASIAPPRPPRSKPKPALGHRLRVSRRPSSPRGTRSATAVTAPAIASRGLVPTEIALFAMLKPGHEEAYDTLHARVPDDLLEAHRRAGIHDWRIWRSGLHVFHLVECDDFDAAIHYLDRDPANERWQQLVGDLVDHFEQTAGGSWELPLVWHMQEQARQGGCDGACKSVALIEPESDADE